MAAPLFSVIVPAYNRAGMLSEALQSVRTQRFTDYELIVVDDGSSDETAAVLEAGLPGVIALRQEHRGPGAARNAGAARASGAYLAFLDSDDLWFPWTLDVYARAIAGAERPSLVLGQPAPFTTASDLGTVAERTVEVAAFADYYAAGDEWHCWGAGFCVIRRDVFEAAGGFVETLINGEDADLVMRIGTALGFVQITSPSTFGYRAHPGNVMSNLDRTIAGAWSLIESERAGRYPGGAARSPARREILSRHLRSLMVAALRDGRRREAWQIYRATAAWHIGLDRWRFLVGFPLLAARPRTRRG